MDRRSLLQRALFLAGATIAPGFSVEALAQAWDEGPQLLDQPRFDLLSAVADTMVPRTDTPGALDAGVPRKFDALLRIWASPRSRQQLTGALETIDRLARDRDKQPFARLTPARRHALLAAHDVAALKPPTAPAGTTGLPPSPSDPNYGKIKQEPPQADTKQEGESIATMRGPPVADPAYQKLKELIVTLYYISEPALTQELRYEHSPGEWKPSVPVTPETRPSGGIGPV
jgi:Gluconate 2-dehydrogenase subunit 3